MPRHQRGQRTLPFAQGAVLAETDAQWLGWKGTFNTALFHASVLSGYELIEEPLGTGGTACVYLARTAGAPPEAEGGLAVKVLFGKAQEGRSAAEHEEELLRREVSLLGEVQGHPNVAALYGICRVHADVDEKRRPLLCSGGCHACSSSEPHLAIVMERCSGGDLFQKAKAAPALEGEAQGIVRGILRGLAHIHGSSIVHRDVKAENVLLAADGRAVIVDFGTAARLDDAEEMRKQSGSPGYCAPEVITKQAYGTRVDSFAAGVLLFFLLSGRRPFGGPSVQEVLKRTLKCKVKFKISTHFDSVSEDCKALILGLL